MEFIDFGSLIPVVAILSSLGFGFIWLRYHELKHESRRMEQEAGTNAVQKRQLEQRLAVLERIVTDRGIETADQIEALAVNREERA
ncbi:MAG: hypothetical protein ACJ8D5_04165 [Sphingomicrobium sp.]